MQEFISKYRDQINGVLSGFDRLVFRGTLRRLNYGYWDQKLAVCGGAGDGAVPVAEPSAVQGLLGSCEAGKPTGETGERPGV